MADMSFSQISNWLICPERFRLERLEKVPTPPTWPLVAGKAVHTATELIDTDSWDMKPDDTAVATAWTSTLEVVIEASIAEDETHTEVEKWRTSRNHGLDWWSANGGRMVANWISTRQEKGWRLFADDPEIGIELYVDGWYGDNRIRGYIDRVLMTADGEPFITDIKTGERPPVFPLQLGVYADLLRRGPMQIDVAGGNYSMVANGTTTPLLDLSGFTTEVITRYTEGLADDLDTGNFLPNPGMFCSTCAVRPQCSVGTTLFFPPPAKTKLQVIKQKEGATK